MGATFKENVADIRNSKVVDVIRELESFGVRVEVVDPHASSAQVKHEYGFELAPKIGKNYDAIILAVNHTEYLGSPESFFLEISKPKGVFVDVKGVYKGKIKQLQYWSL
jgi:UDP-N-acetyl-D-galactosamine dehydrogenase